LNEIGKYSFLKKSVVEIFSCRDKKARNPSKIVQMENETDGAGLGDYEHLLGRAKRISHHRGHREYRVKSGEGNLGFSS
jgi:hypothetical protein